MLHWSLLFGLLGVHGFHLRTPIAALPKSSRALATKVSAVSNPTETRAVEDQSKINDGKFDWNKQWYPVLDVASADPERAHALQLLGKDLVVWRNNKGRWSTFDDRCPHRAAPLTEGRVEKDGSLLCAYHAWRFDADGKCLSIPQSEKGGRDEAQSAACAKVYPTKVAQGIIWVWGDNGVDAGLESAITPAATIPELEGPEMEKKWKVNTANVFYHRDMAYSWETFVENVVDPAHVVVSHHGLMGSRYDAEPLSLDMTSLNQAGFSFDTAPTNGSAVGFVTSLVAPSLVRLDFDVTKGRKMIIALYNVPTRPGWSRMISSRISLTPRDSNDRSVKHLMMNAVSRLKIPTWAQHVVGHKFMNQDMAFLHHQEKIMANAGYDSSNYGQGVYVPAASDKGVMALRKWVMKFASGGPSWAKGCDPNVPARERNRNVLFDVYEQHTKNCVPCLGALKRVNQGLRVAKASVVASLVWAVLRGARAAGEAASPSAPVLNVITATAMLPGLATAAGGLACIKFLEKLRKSFHFGNYHHQDND